MTAHSNAAILKAYADDTELVIFMLGSNSKWHRTNPKALMDYPDDKFFACLPQHEDACLYWLNGGDVKGKSTGAWINYCPAIKADWNNCTSFMDSDFEIVIKPRKEKRWIALNAFGDVMPVHCKDLDSAKQLVQYKDVGINGDIQYIEIEVEV